MSGEPDFLTCLILLAGDSKVYGSFEIDQADVDAGVLLVRRSWPPGRVIAHRVTTIQYEGKDCPAITFPSVSEIVWFVHHYAEIRTRHKINYSALDISDRWGKTTCERRAFYLRKVENSDVIRPDPYRASEFYGGGA